MDSKQRDAHILHRQNSIMETRLKLEDHIFPHHSNCYIEPKW